MKISVIIPCLNEENYLPGTLHRVLGLEGNFEIIVVDGGSTDDSLKIAETYPEVKTFSTRKGRANQMNHGAAMATGEVLLFLHADTLLPHSAYNSIVHHLQNPGYIGGSFLLKFDSENSFLQFYSWCSKWSLEFFTYGDHAMFMEKEVFEAIGGYRSLPFMEDVEIQKRLRASGKFRKVNSRVTTSARRFNKEGTVKQLLMDVLLVGFFKMGVSPEKLKGFYKDHGLSGSN